ncbi:MAG: alpha-amylase family glycosyl hydrolase [Caldilineales bacterium]|nr:alpha-amylase family glycosyl hydrolase [Caldilineales bacterium]MDW8317013.1 alpha-amylase family glycosyl hydrolase [Anaerolineae bacterium]
MSDDVTVTTPVMQDFVFGALETDANTLAAERRRWLGVRHGHAIQPLDPVPDQPVAITVTLGRDVLADGVTAYVTTDGSEPAGRGGQAVNGFAVPLRRVETRFQPLYWDFAEVWQGELPGQPEGTHVRYTVEAWREGQSVWAAEPHIDGTVDARTVYGYVVDRVEPPAWAHDAIVYQIVVDRFAPAPQRWLEPAEMETFVGGTLRGIVERLDYIADLGVNTLWLTPIFRAASYHGYDTVDYFDVDPRFGSQADLAELVRQAHARGLRVILDFVANHCSDRFPLFREALADPASPHRRLFIFDPSFPHGYRCFFTAANMPQFNHDHPAARRLLLDAAQHWLREFGVDGYRLDYAAGPSHDFWSEFRAACKAVNPDCWLFGEVTLGSDALRTYVGRLDGCLDFAFTRQARLLCAGEGPAEPISRFAASLLRAERYFPADFTRPAFVENHDMNRFLWVAGGDRARLRMALGLLLGLGRSPILYYGTEVGLGQPRAKGHYREEARHPMRWDEAQDRALLADVRRLVAFRRRHPALSRGPTATLHLDDDTGLWLAERRWEDDRALIAVNAGAAAGHLTLPPGRWVDAHGRPAAGSLAVDPRSVVLLAPAAA